VKLESNITLANGIYRAQLGLTANDPLTGAERDALSALGPVSVEIGGDIVAAGHTTFTLPTQTLRFPTDFPIVQTFDRTLTNPVGGQRATNWVAAMRTRVVAAMTELVETQRGFVGQVVSTHDLT
jgi:predicted sugar kinase